MCIIVYSGGFILEKAEEPEIKLPTSVGSSKKRESSRKTSTALLTTPKPLTVCSSVQLLSCVWLCDPMDCSMPSLPVYHQLPEFTQTQVHWVSDALQQSHPLLYPFPPTFNLPQHQGLFQWVSSSHQVAKVLEFQLQHQFFQWIFRTDFLKNWLVESPCCPRDSQEFSNTTIQKHQFFSSKLSL